MNTEIESTVSSATVNLAFALRLSPLDRVQLATVWEFGQMRHHRQMYGDGELPFFFFQRVIDNERIEVRNPAGRDAVVSALDVCDVRRTTPLIIQAMSQPVFLERLKNPPATRGAPTPELYAPAYVLYASKAKSGALQAHVWFVDAALNVTGTPWAAPLLESDRRRFEAAARRTVMPVSEWRLSGAYSADAGCAQEERRHQAAAGAFFTSALAGDLESVAKISCNGLKQRARVHAKSRSNPD